MDLDNIQYKYELVLNELRSLKDKNANLLSVINLKDSEIESKVNIIKEKDKLLEEKDNIITNFRKMTISDNNNVVNFDQFNEDDAEFTFDDLVDRYPLNKRFTEVPVSQERMIKKGHENVFYKEDEFLEINDTIIEENYQLNQVKEIVERRSSKHNKLHDIATNPK
jgi:predicted nuclease with TOPRIM domain